MDKKEMKATWDSLVDSTKKYAKLAKEELVRSSKIGKVRLEITKTKKKKSQKLKELGELSYQLILEGKIEIEGADPIKSEIDTLDAEIKGKEAEIEEILKQEEIEIKKDKEK